MSIDDSSAPGNFLDTQQKQADVVKKLIKELDKELKIIMNDHERYHMQTVIIILYTGENIKAMIKDKCRVTDLFRLIKIGDGYFSVVFLTFTNIQGGYQFLTHIEHALQNACIDYRFSIDEVNRTAIKNLFNFFGNFLFEIKERDPALF